MRIFLTSPAIPRADGSAVHVVLNETIRALGDMGHEVVFQIICSDRLSLTDLEERQLSELQARGVRVLPPIFAPTGGAQQRRFLVHRIRRAFLPRVSEVYPTIRLTDEVARRVEKSGADALLIFWDPEGLAATFGLGGIRKVAYYGMPDYMTTEARLKHPGLFDIPHRSFSDKLRLGLARNWNRKQRKLHFKLMRDCDVTTNICAFHAELYRAMGHPRALYMRNMWPDSRRQGWREERRRSGSAQPYKLLSSLGSVRATGNTFGLFYLGTEILPRLERRLGSGSFEINIYGNGVPYPQVARALSRPSVRVRGWVPDLDAAILSSRIFLMMNNTGTCKGSHTRFLHAWTLGACVVAHKINAAAMPEIRHMENALLGEDADEITDLIELALKDDRLRSRIGEGGRQTYEACFRPHIVVPKLIELLLANSSC